MTPQTIAKRLSIIEQIPSWSMWWLTNPPTNEQRVMRAVEELRKDIERANKEM